MDKWENFSIPLLLRVSNKYVALKLNIFILQYLPEQWYWPFLSPLPTLKSLWRLLIQTFCLRKRLFNQHQKTLLVFFFAIFSQEWRYKYVVSCNPIDVFVLRVYKQQYYFLCRSLGKLQNQEYSRKSVCVLPKILGKNVCAFE